MGEAKILLNLLWEVYKAVKNAKKQNEIEKIRENPRAWLGDHFGGVRDKSDETGKTKL